MPKNPFERAQQEQTAAEQEAAGQVVEQGATPSETTEQNHYAIDKQGVAHFGATPGDAVDKAREANEGYN
jgi:ribosomal protein S16